MNTMGLICAVALLAWPQAVQAQSAQQLFQTGKDHSMMGEDAPALVAFEKAAALGLADAAHMAAQSYHYGWTGIRNFRKAASYYDQVIAGSDSAYTVQEAKTQRQAMLGELGNLAFDAARKRDLSTAERYYNLGVELGDGSALGNLARFYETGRFGWPRDEVKARALYERLAEQGPNDTGLWALGLMYKEGRGGGTDYERAAAAFQAMIDMGSLSGNMEMAKLYLEGKGVRQDRGIARELLRRPCDLGIQEACDLGGLTPAPLPGS